MNNIARVLERITSIEKRFAVAKPAGSFQAIMDKVAQSQDGSDTSDSIKDILQASAQKYGVDAKLVTAVAKAESDLTSGVVSSAGAVGVMQVMPETARELGVKNIFDTNENIDAGVRYLKQMLSTFNGDVTKAVAAYNAGPQAVINYNGVPPYRETEQYVKKVMSEYK